MSQIYQEYFKEDNLVFFFKYDGIRNANLYTIMIADKQSLDNKLVRDTDKPYTVYSEFINRKNINKSADSMFYLFMNFSEELINKFNKNIVFVFTIEMLETISFHVNIALENERHTCTKSSVEDIEEFLSSL